MLLKGLLAFLGQQVPKLYVKYVTYKRYVMKCQQNAWYNIFLMKSVLHSKQLVNDDYHADRIIKIDPSDITCAAFNGKDVTDTLVLLMKTKNIWNCRKLFDAILFLEPNGGENVIDKDEHIHIVQMLAIEILETKLYPSDVLMSNVG